MAFLLTKSFIIDQSVKFDSRHINANVIGLATKKIWLVSNSALYYLWFSPLVSLKTNGIQATSLNTHSNHQ